MTKKNTMIFLDRDGVINRKNPDAYFIQHPGQFEFLPGVAQAIQLLNRHGFHVVVVTNQRGVSTGAHTEEELGQVHEYMISMLREQGAFIDALYYCPHAANSCDCRKPEIGLFTRAFNEFADVLPARSIVVGDSLCDMEAAHRLQCRKVLIANDAGPVTAAAGEKGISIDYCAGSLLDAVNDFILPMGKDVDAGAIR